jgi:MOSC domain-containing protein YiiM
MLFKWSGFTRNNSRVVSLSAIFIAESAGMPMQSLKDAQAVSNKGILGDRYLNKTGYWDPVEGCQLTLISEHDLKQAKHDSDLTFDKGQHRRNLVINGIKTRALEGKTFQIGEAIFSYEKPRPPCGYLNKIEGKGMALALSYNSGICIRVIRSGKLRVGDSVIILGSSGKQ